MKRLEEENADLMRRLQEAVKQRDEREVPTNSRNSNDGAQEEEEGGERRKRGNSSALSLRDAEKEMDEYQETIAHLRCVLRTMVSQDISNKLASNFRI